MDRQLLGRRGIAVIAIAAVTATQPQLVADPRAPQPDPAGRRSP
ncbi:hypothetical protein [Amycolatopsis sp. cmx-8-4]